MSSRWIHDWIKSPSDHDAMGEIIAAVLRGDCQDEVYVPGHGAPDQWVPASHYYADTPYPSDDDWAAMVDVGEVHHG